MGLSITAATWDVRSGRASLDALHAERYRCASVRTNGEL